MTREECISHLQDIICENNTIKHSDMVVFELEKEALRMAISTLEQQKTGRWIWIESIGAWKFKCSVCKESVNPMPTCMGKPLMRYCPACGAKMEVEE